MAILRLILPVISLLLLSNFNGCSPQENNTNNIHTVQIDTLKSFIDYNNSEIVQPAAIEILSNSEIAVLDNKLNQVFVFRRDGELKFRFGSEGRGPGEFVHSMYLQKSSKYLNVLDVSQFRINQFNYKGDFVRSYDYAPPKLSLSRRALVLKEKKYFVEAMGKKNCLIKMVNAKSDTAVYFGKSMGKYSENLDITVNRRILQKGNIPPLFKNRLSMYYSNDNLYVFLNSYSRLQKYNSDSELIWDKKIDLPVNQKIFNNVVTNAQDSNGIPALIYLHSMKVIEGKTYLLWHRTKEEPQRIVKIDQTGQIEKIFLLPRDHFYGEIAIDKQQNILYVASANSGKVFRKQINEL